MNRSRSRSRSSRDSSFSRSPWRIAEQVTEKNYDAHRKAITASVKFMENHELCCVVLEGTGEVLCHPPVEYLKCWSTVLRKAVESESNFKVEFRADGKREVTISKTHDAVVARAFFMYIYTGGNMVEVLNTLQSQCSSSSIEQKWLQLIMMADYYDVDSLVGAALEFVTLSKDVMDNINLNLEHLLKLRVHTRAALYNAGYSCQEILQACGHSIGDEDDIVEGCLKYNIMDVRQLLGMHEPQRVILACVSLWGASAVHALREVKQFAKDNKLKYAVYFIDPEIGLKKNDLIEIGYSLSDLVEELPASCLEDLGFKSHRIDRMVQQKAKSKSE